MRRPPSPATPLKEVGVCVKWSDGDYCTSSGLHEFHCCCADDVDSAGSIYYLPAQKHTDGFVFIRVSEATLECPTWVPPPECPPRLVYSSSSILCVGSVQGTNRATSIEPTAVSRARCKETLLGASQSQLSQLALRPPGLHFNKYHVDYCCCCCRLKREKREKMIILVSIHLYRSVRSRGER